MTENDRSPEPSGISLLDQVAAVLGSARGRTAMVTAPAGYGKSTQVAAWAAEDGRMLAWVDIEPVHNDPTVLAATAIDALTGLARVSSGDDSPSAPASDDLATLLSVIGEVGRTCTTPSILVLDGVHLVEDARAIDVIDAIARSVPASSTLVLIARAEPHPGLTRIRTHRGAVDVTAAQLALTTDQVGRLLDGMGVSLDGDALQQLVHETEGWPVGVRLAALALLADPLDATATAGRVQGDRETARYLRAEWLRCTSADDLDLLRQLAVLDRLSGPLCDHVLDRTGTAAVLERLHDDRLLLIPLDRRHQVFRMHRLLRDVLETELQRADPDTWRLRHSRASEWFEEQGDIDGALQHAIAAGDLDRAGQLVEAHTAAYQMKGHYATVARWIDAFPDGYFASRPSLCLVAAVAALGDPGCDGARVLAWLRTGDAVLTDDADPLTRLRFDALRALVSTSAIDEAIGHARQAVDGLPPGIWHSIACLAHGALSFAAGDDERAADLLTQAAAEAEVHRALTTVAVSRAHLALVRSHQGDPEGAAPLVRSARALITEHHLEHYPTMILVTAMAAHAEAVAGNPERARDEWLLTRQNLASMRGVAPWANVQARLALARTSLLLSDRSDTRLLLEEAESIVLAQPEAIRPKAQLAELQGLLERASTSQWSAFSLTTAELRVLHYLPTNLTLSDIAARLFVSRNTTKSHAISIYRKLGAKTRGDAVEIAEAAGLLSSRGGSST